MLDHRYYCELLEYSVHDGDTLTRCTLDLGFNCAIRQQSIRLARIQAPELRSHPQGAAAKEYLAELLGEGPCILYSSRWDKYRRILGEVFVRQGTEWVNASNKLLEVGLAKPYGEKNG